jgi:hypothetical protein
MLTGAARAQEMKRRREQEELAHAEHIRRDASDYEQREAERRRIVRTPLARLCG